MKRRTVSVVRDRFERTPPPARPLKGAGARKSAREDQFSATRVGQRLILSMRSFIMAFVRVEQRNAHLASAVRLVSVQGRDGQPVSKANITAISNTKKGRSENRGEEATAIYWTLWGKQAENAAQYLGKGSHVNVVGRVQNNHYEREGETIYTLAFTAEEIDYLDSKAEGEALRAPKPSAKGKAAAKGKKAVAPAVAAGVDDDIPF
jgi:single-strand DNA-binding protein